MATQESVTSSVMTSNYSTSSNVGADVMTTETYVWIFTLPIIFIIGVCGNILTVLVMHRKRMCGTATSVYLTSLAIADTAVLVTGLIPEWLNQTGIKDVAEIHHWVCKFERFLFYTSGDVAIWILVAFTCDRCIAVCFPLKKCELCTPRRAKIACIITLVAGFVKNVHIFWTRGVVFEDGVFVENCGKPDPYAYFERKVRPWIVMVLVSLGPFIIIFVCNVMIVKELVWSRRMRNSSTPGKQKVFTQTTAMCLSTSFAFLILITPSIVLLIGKPYWTSGPEHNTAYGIAKAVNNQLMFLNHSINFCLYCLTGARFRDELADMCKCRNNVKQQGKVFARSPESASTSIRCSPVPDTPQFVRPGKGRISRNDVKLNGDFHVQSETDTFITKETVT